MKRSKYGNKKCEYLGLKFDSIGERDRYIFLLDCQSRGNIRNLCCQVRFKLDVDGEHICDYIADFVYDKKLKYSFTYIVEDFKSKATITDVFRIKSKLMKAIHGIDVKVVKNTTEEL